MPNSIKHTLQRGVDGDEICGVSAPPDTSRFTDTGAGGLACCWLALENFGCFPLELVLRGAFSKDGRAGTEKKYIISYN